MMLMDTTNSLRHIILDRPMAKTVLYAAHTAEGAIYVEMSKKAFELWPQIEQKSGLKLLNLNGCLDISDGNKDWAERSHALAREYGIESWLLNNKQAQEILPLFNFTPKMTIAYSPLSGTLKAELSTQAFLDNATKSGAKINIQTKVSKIDANTKTLYFHDGKKEKFDVIIIAAGTWLSKLIDIPVTIEKRIMGWYTSDNVTSNFPGFSYSGETHSLYGMPSLEGGSYKVGESLDTEKPIDADAPLVLDEGENEYLNQCVFKSMSSLDIKNARYAACKYTRAPDKNFIIDRHSDNPDILIFSPCSGHGFKYAPVYGEIAQAMVKEQEDTLPFNISEFSLSRFKP